MLRIQNSRAKLCKNRVVHFIDDIHTDQDHSRSEDPESDDRSAQVKVHKAGIHGLSCATQGDLSWRGPHFGIALTFVTR